ncbi:MAG TPA: hypothetical protein PLC65_16070 [Bacteroidia bacterium]|nr:hypothetical protein [Bacteroidia bacterium]
MKIEQSHRPKMTIYLDFDGTVVEHQYPLIGSYNVGCIEVIDKLYKAGHEIVINTMRVEYDKTRLMEAVEFLNKLLSNLNNNTNKYSLSYTDSKKDPTKWDWNLHFKTMRIFIDDVCEGIPLKNGVSTNRAMVDWEILNVEFEERGLFNEQT